MAKVSINYSKSSDVEKLDSEQNKEGDKLYREYLDKKIEAGYLAIKEGRVLSHEEALQKVLKR